MERHLTAATLSPEMFAVLRPDFVLCLDDQPFEKRGLAAVLELGKVAQHFDHHRVPEVHRVVDPTEGAVELAPQRLLQMRAVLQVDPLEGGGVSFRGLTDVLGE
jgi:hypothetical protein